MLFTHKVLYLSSSHLLHLPLMVFFSVLQTVLNTRSKSTYQLINSSTYQLTNWESKYTGLVLMPQPSYSVGDRDTFGYVNLLLQQWPGWRHVNGNFVFCPPWKSSPMSFALPAVRVASQSSFPSSQRPVAVGLARSRASCKNSCVGSL